MDTANTLLSVPNSYSQVMQKKKKTMAFLGFISWADFLVKSVKEVCPI